MYDVSFEYILKWIRNKEKKTCEVLINFSTTLPFIVIDPFSVHTYLDKLHFYRM